MAVDDSCSSPSVRELDDVFFQSQARIWLEEVLHMRFDEQLSICDLLSDGELLFEVSKALWNMLLAKYTELNSIKAPIDTRKSSGRYRPYSNVDSFLKVCKVMGLSGMDLFSPSDVVDKRDMRNVCICIRSLSKEARSKKLNIPDFDLVTKTVAKPTEFIGCITKSVESSPSRNAHGVSNEIQKNSFASQEEDASCLEETDEAKSSFSDTSYADILYLESEDSPETIYKFAPTQDDVAFDFDASSEPDDHGNSVLSTPDSREPESEIHGKGLVSCNLFLETRFEETTLENIDFSAYSFSPCWDDVKSYCSEDQDVESQNQICGTNKYLGDSLVLMKDGITNVVESIQELVVSKGADDNVKKYENQLCTNRTNDAQCCSEYGTKASSKDERKGYGIDCLTEANDKRMVNTKKNSTYIAPLLKTIAKGTALIGILILLHLRIGIDGNTNNKFSGLGLSGKGGKGRKIYPVHKFKFRD